MAFPSLSVVLATILSLVAAQSGCSSTLEPIYPVTVASGYQAGLVATGLARPRGIVLDNAGRLLVVEENRGGNSQISALTLRDDGGPCLGEASRKIVVQAQGLNHGIALSADGTVLYASNVDSAWRWTYNSAAQTTSDQRLLVGAMAGSDHVTRTLLLSQLAPDMLIISRGSNSNMDSTTADITSGAGQIRAFNISNVAAAQNYTFATDGVRLGWGLRNSVGVAEHPNTGGIWSMENSADSVERDGVSIQDDNPGDEMNFHGRLSGPPHQRQGDNYGYPECYAVWNIQDLPRAENLSVGSQFASDEYNANDTYCAAQVPPRLTFVAHQTPLDLKFNNSGTEAWISFHGGWNQDIPIGHKLSMVPFENGKPVASRVNTTAALDIFANAVNDACPEECVRPVGLAFDTQGRLFMSSDATGEIYVIVRDQSTSTHALNGDQDSHTGAAPKDNVSAPSMLALIVLAGYLTFG